MVRKNPNLDLVNINAYTKFGEILSICSQEEMKLWWMDKWSDGIKGNPISV